MVWSNTPIATFNIHYVSYSNHPHTWFALAFTVNIFVTTFVHHIIYETSIVTSLVTIISFPFELLVGGDFLQ